MNLLEKTIIEKEELYNVAEEYFYKIDSNEYENVKFDKIISKSIAILIDHDFIPTPCIQIKLELYKGLKVVGSYFLYLDENKEFVDEFLIVE